MQFSVIVIDCPFKFNDHLKMSKTKRSSMDHYKTLTNKELATLDIASLADPTGCMIASWCPSSLLEEGIELLKAWDFQFKGTYCWVKIKKDSYKLENCLSFGLGNSFRQTHELALIGVNNNRIYKKLKNKSQRSVCFSANFGHSKKPEYLQDSLDIMFPDDNKIELFARRMRQGWTCIGNEVCDGEDIFDSIERIKNLTTIGE